MTEQPTARPVARRIDPAAADTETLVDMGVLPEQPTPEYEGLFQEPDWPQEE
jgi:hypothetical protein